MNRLYVLGMRRFADPTGIWCLEIRVGCKAGRKPFSEFSRFVATCGDARVDLLNTLRIGAFAVLLPAAQFLEFMATRRGARNESSAIRGIRNFGLDSSASSVGLGSSSNVHARGPLRFEFRGTNSCGDFKTRSSLSKAIF